MRNIMKYNQKYNEYNKHLEMAKMYTRIQRAYLQYVKALIFIIIDPDNEKEICQYNLEI